jgi:hypothetical protein
MKADLRSPGHASAVTGVRQDGVPTGHRPVTGGGASETLSELAAPLSWRPMPDNPPYLAIADQLRAEILAGTWDRPDVPFSGARAVGERFGVSIHTASEPFSNSLPRTSSPRAASARSWSIPTRSPPPGR